MIVNIFTQPVDGWFGESRRLLPVSAMMLKEFTGPDMDAAADTKRAVVRLSLGISICSVQISSLRFVTCIGNAACRREIVR